MKKPDYCEYTDVKSCEECSLTNYNRDCRNNQISKMTQTSIWFEADLFKNFKIQMAKNGDNNQSEVIRRLIKKHYLKD